MDLQRRGVAKAVAYTAPEVLRRESLGGAAADLWALGCILGAFLKRRPLFAARDGQELHEQLVQIEESKRKEISEIEGSVRRDALEILLDDTPTHRGTAKELLQMAGSLKGFKASQRHLKR